MHKAFSETRNLDSNYMLCTLISRRSTHFTKLIENAAFYFISAELLSVSPDNRLKFINWFYGIKKFKGFIWTSISPPEVNWQRKIKAYPLLACFPQKGTGSLWHHHLSVWFSYRLSIYLRVPLNKFEQIIIFLWNSVGKSCHWRWSQYHFLIT
jgi:hypothetical protein